MLVMKGKVKQRQHGVVDPLGVEVHRNISGKQKTP